MKIIIACFMILFVFPLFSKDYTLDEIYKIIDANNYSVKQLEKMSASLKNQADMEGSDLMDTAIGYGLNDLTINNSGIDPDMLTHKFYLKQQIPLSGRLYFRKKAAYYEYINSMEETKMKKLELKKMVLSEITDWHLFNEVELNRKKELELLTRLSGIVKTQFTTGLSPLSSLTQVNIRIAQSEIMLLEIEYMKKSLENEILNILVVGDGSFEMSDLKFSHELIDTSNIKSDALFQKALDFNPSLKIKDNEILKVQNMKSASVSELVPNLEIMFEYMLKPNPEPVNSFNFQFEINVPLLSAYSKANRILMYKKLQDQADFGKKAAENDLKNYLKRKVIDLNNHVDQAKLLYEKILTPSEENINSILQSYQVNKITIDSFIDSSLMVYDLENQYYDHLGNIYKILYELEFLTGEKYYNFGGKIGK